jgi:tripeptide aminopeptidase
MKIERLIERAITIQSIPAPTFSEGARAAWLYKEFDKLDLGQPERDPTGNIYLCLPGGEELPVIVSAHLDTVFPMETPLQVKRTSDCIYGPGIGDNSISLAVLLELAEDLHDTNLPGDVWLVANVGEEGLGNLLGMRKVVSRFGDQVSAYIVLEGMSLGHIYHRGSHVRRFRISAEGPGGHPWIHNRRPSAIHKLIEISHDLLGLTLPTSPKTTLNVGLFHGGTTINSIAGQAFFEIDLRSEDARMLDDFTQTIEALITSKAVDNLTLKSKIIGERPGGHLAEKHPLIKATKQALQSAGQKKISLETGSTDANVPLSMGLPAVCVCITHGGGAHSMEEYIEIPPIKQGYASIYKLIHLAFELQR